MARICIKGLQKEVKNLRWLRRNWEEVDRFEVVSPTFSEGPLRGFIASPNTEAILIAYMKTPGDWYMTGFSSRRVLLEFLDRPVFQGLPLTWYGVKGFHIGKNTMPSPRDVT
ncbi:hypothetical protein [Myxococcus phage Mx1]|nr:hypothetical protein [Myxococcus phage Mx1]